MPATVEPASPAPAPVASASTDDVGVSGTRLTREDAFDLLRRSVAATVRANAPARAGDIRRAARELLGRDSESLSERNFTLILKDAHDSDVIDLRRRGDDYEVAPAVTAAPIAAQLGHAEQANAPVAAAVPPAPRGMGLRGVPARQRGGAKSAAPPLDLLSVGVVDFDTPPSQPSRPAPVAASGAAATPDTATPTQPSAPATRERRPRPRKAAAKKTTAPAASATPAAKTPARSTRKKTAARK